MAANFWESTQRRYWLFSKDELAAMRQKLEDEDPNLVQSFPLPELRHLNIYFNQRMAPVLYPEINRLGKRLGVRQQALATAQVYIKRFYTRVEIRRTNPYLVIATSLYLACKMEECPQHIRLVVQEARGLWPTELHGQDTSKLGECEFFLISEMSSQLIVHQPYRTLTTLQNDLGLTADEAQGAWSVINDHYMTDLPLLYPPHVIALTAVLLAMVLRPSPPGGNMAGGGSGQPNSAGGLAMAASTLAQMQAAQQAHAARMAAAGGGGGSGIGSAPGTPTLTPQGSYSGQTPQVGEYPSQTKKIPDARFVKVQRFSAWLAESNVDIEGMIDCTQELISFYECHEGYNDKGTREQINRFIKARGLDK